MSNLPAFPTPLVGRHDELAEINRLLADPSCRLLTLVGPGGIGKTRLAIEAARIIAANLGTRVAVSEPLFPNGVYLVSLQPLNSLNFIVPTIAEVLHFQFYPGGEPKQQLLDYLREKSLLLVLDNFEHLLDGVEILSEILSCAPAVKILTTSRERLNLVEEWVLEVQGLPFPDVDADTEIEDYGAVQLFMQNAQRVQVGFSLTDTQKPAVTRICRLVGGMPLGIELASVWVRALSCEEIAAEIESSLDILTTPARNVEPRHRTMHAAFEPTWNRLSEDERGAFQKLSVFRGGFTREAAEYVAGATLQTLSVLVDKSLVRADANGRYQIHELLRQYGEERLLASPDEANNVSDLHCAYYAQYLQEMDNVTSFTSPEAYTEITVEVENIRTAWRWAVEHTEVEVIEKAANTLLTIYQFRNWYLEGADAFEKAAQRLESSGRQGLALVTVLIAVGWLSLRLGQVENARAAFEKSHTICKTLNISPPSFGAMDPLTGLSIVASVVGDYSQAIQLAQQACESCEAREDRNNLPYAYYALASAWLAQGDYQAAAQSAQQAFAYAKAVNALWVMAYCLNALGSATRALGNYAEARQHYQSSYTIREQYNDAEGMAVALNHLGKVAGLQGDHHEAAQLYQQSLALYHDLGDRGGLATALSGLGGTAGALGEYTAARQYFHDALEMALSVQLIPLALSILIDISELLLTTNRQERGIELLALSLHHPAGDYETKERATRLVSRYQVSPDRLAGIAQRRPTSDLETVSAGLLDELLAPEALTTATHTPRADWTLVEPPSERELEVLHLIAEGYSNREIANQLYISVNTVKKHINHLFGKLNVKNRIEAVSQARRLNILH